MYTIGKMCILFNWGPLNVSLLFDCIIFKLSKFKIQTSEFDLT